MREELLACASSSECERVLAALPDRDLERLYYDWEIWARDDQLDPEAVSSGWRTWLILGGRGAGKTRAGAEWVRRRVAEAARGGSAGEIRIALVGETLADVRMIMVEGVSGLLGVHPPDERPVFEPSKRQLRWASGATAQMFSAEEPDGLRGPQFVYAWCDEIAKWRHAERTWDMLQFALRLGERPRQVVTTTPRPVPLVKRLLGEPDVVLSRARTADNAVNLAASFLASMRDRYEGTPLGRQELEGELIEDRADALWKRGWFDQDRIAAAPADLAAVVVAVDPPVTSGPGADACGIVAAGRAGDGRFYVLGDRTLQGREPLAWAKASVMAFHDFAADRLVAEVNQGGELVASVIRQVEPAIAVRMVRATRGKWLRAEPVAALYAQGRVSHVGSLAALEDQMCDFGPDGLSGGRSPDRLDALVWALTELMQSGGERPQIRSI